MDEITDLGDRRSVKVIERFEIKRILVELILLL